MKSALIVIDVQKSFVHRPYWSNDDAPEFLTRLQRLVDQCAAHDIPALQVFHVDSCDPADPFSRESGLIETLPPLRLEPQAVFQKSVHSALFARDSGGVALHDWLQARRIERLIISGIRTEQCCETTARHASDLGYKVTYVMDATLTFAMESKAGRRFTPGEIKERTELVLAGRFAEVVRSEAMQW
jgi:nicotinamidase-related amidase